MTERANAPAGSAAAADSAGASAEPAEALAALVARLRTELTGVRTAMRNRAVIEQAKGVLVERLGITPDQGFDHLVRLSQRANIKLIEVAAAIVGTTAPDPADTGHHESVGTGHREPVDAEYREHLARTRARRPNSTAPTPAVRRRPARPPAIEALQAKHQLISARVSGARAYDEIAEAIATADAPWPAPDLVALFLLEPDGALVLVGSHGMSPELRSQWGRIPPDPALPLVVAVRDTDVVWLPNPDVAARRFPALFALPFPNAAYYAAPLVAAGRVVGGIAVSWDEAVVEAELTGRYLTALLAPVARRVTELRGEDLATAWSHYLPGAAASGGGQAEVWLPAVLDTLHTPALLLSPIRDKGQVVDFRIEYANGLARQVVTAAGVDDGQATLLAMYPGVGSGTLLPAFTHALHRGDPLRITDLHVAARGEGIERSQHLTVHAVRLWDRILMIFRIHTDADLLHDQLLEAERIARIGSFSWDLRTREPRCSPELYRMYHGDARSDAIGAEDLAACVHPDDLVTVRDTAERSIAAGRPLTTEFRGGGRMAGRRLRVTAEPVLSTDGSVRLVRGTVQDVTQERAREGRLRLAEEAVAAARRQLESERKAAEALQRALLPTDPELGIAEGVEICGRCRATAKTGDVDGDWYDAMPMASGAATALMLGDVADTGLSSMTTAARLRYAVRAYASLDMPPGDILTAVNSMLWMMEVEHTAKLVVARYEPATRQLRWAAAGQVAPIRYDADRRGSVLAGPLGLPLGTAPEVKYHEATVTLAEGDRVLFYTDGLVKADRRRSGALDVLLHAGRDSDLSNLETLVDHITSKLGARPEEDMCAMLVRVTC